MRMLVTGAGGFIGRATVAEAVARGHRVRAVLRPGAEAPAFGAEAGGDAVEFVYADLRERESIRDVVRDMDVVVHLAAAMQGDDAEHRAVTVRGTAHLLDAMVAAGVRRLVAVSSIAVYDVLAAGGRGPVDETCPLEARPKQRDPYCRGKLTQEALIREWAERAGLEAVILRPGVVHGPGRRWSPRVGLRLAPRLWMIPAPFAPLPLVTRQSCAEAIVLAAERRDVAGLTLNVVDDGAPSRWRYARAIGRLEGSAPWLLVLPAWLVRPIGGLVLGLIRLVPGRRPGVGPYSRRRFAARFTPRSYANALIKERLGWTPRTTFETGDGGEGRRIDGL